MTLNEAVEMFDKIHGQETRSVFNEEWVVIRQHIEAQEAEIKLQRDQNRALRHTIVALLVAAGGSVTITDADAMNIDLDGALIKSERDLMRPTTTLSLNNWRRG